MQRNSPPKQILMILENGSFPEDTRVYLEAKALADAGYAISVVCPTGKSRKFYEVVEKVQVYRYPKPLELNGFLGYLLEYTYSFFMAFCFALWISIRTGFDAVHIHCPPDLNSMLAIFFKCFGKKFVVDLHDLSPELYVAQKQNQSSRILIRGLNFFERLASRNANALIATNQSQHTAQIVRCGAEPSRCYIVRNGPNELFHPELIPLDELVIPGKIIVGYVGVMGFQDGVDNFIHVMAKIRKYRDDIVAVLVGKGAAFESLRKLTNELGLSNCVRFTGVVDFHQVPRYIASFDICVTPDPSNPYNDSCTTIKTMEYMAVGRPVVAFRTKENEVTAGEAAWYAENNSIDEFAELVSKLADQPEQRRVMGRIGRDRIENSLSWDHQKKSLLDVYEKLFSQRREE